MIQLPPAYLAEVRRVSSALEENAWFVGGWVLAALLKRPYAGDIDLISSHEPQRISETLYRTFSNATRTARGGIRINLEDSNYIDVHSTRSFFNSQSILEALEKFRYSANSVAINTNTQEIVRTKQNYADLSLREFGFANDHPSCDEQDQLSILRDYGKLEGYFGLTPTNLARNRVQQVRSRAMGLRPRGSWPEIADQVLRQVNGLIPDNARAWLCRGAVRAALLDEITEWDDFDILVDCSDGELVEHLDGAGISYVVGYFGAPKVRQPDGRHVDLIALGGRRLEYVLSTFYPLSECMAVSLSSGEFHDPIGARRSLCQHALSMGPVGDNLPDASRRFIALKAVYLMLRHRLSADPLVRELVATPMNFSFFDRRNATRMIQELASYSREDWQVMGHYRDLSEYSAMTIMRELSREI